MPNLVCDVCHSTKDVKIIHDVDEGTEMAFCRDCRIDFGYEKCDCGACTGNKTHHHKLWSERHSDDYIPVEEEDCGEKYSEW
jgi:ribosome-binding protein aMBF1 (putative translation factor)